MSGSKVEDASSVYPSKHITIEGPIAVDMFNAARFRVRSNTGMYLNNEQLVSFLVAYYLNQGEELDMADGG